MERRRLLCRVREASYRIYFEIGGQRQTEASKYTDLSVSWGVFFLCLVRKLISTACTAKHCPRDLVQPLDIRNDLLKRASGSAVSVTRR